MPFRFRPPDPSRPHPRFHPPKYTLPTKYKLNDYIWFLIISWFAAQIIGIVTKYINIAKIANPM